MRLRKVLVVDDEPDIRRVGQLSLELMGQLEVIVASSGEEAVEKAALERPDAILLDVRMPGLDGPATLDRLRARAETADIPVIFMTARSDGALARALVGRGAAGVIQKPFDPTTLAAQVGRLVGGEV